MMRAVRRSSCQSRCRRGDDGIAASITDDFLPTRWRAGSVVGFDRGSHPAGVGRRSDERGQRAARSWTRSGHPRRGGWTNEPVVDVESTRLGRCSWWTTCARPVRRLSPVRPSCGDSASRTSTRRSSGEDHWGRIPETWANRRRVSCVVRGRGARAGRAQEAWPAFFSDGRRWGSKDHAERLIEARRTVKKPPGPWRFVLRAG